MRIYITKKDNNNKTLHKKSMAMSSKLKDRIANDHKKLLPIMVSGVMKDLGQRSTSWQAKCWGPTAWEYRSQSAIGDFTRDCKSERNNWTRQNKLQFA